MPKSLLFIGMGVIRRHNYITEVVLLFNVNGAALQKMQDREKQRHHFCFRTIAGQLPEALIRGIAAAEE